MHIVICDDVKNEAEATAACLRDYFQQHNLSLPSITIVSNGQQLQQQQQVDLLFLDIELEQESGIALAAHWNRTNPQTMIVFVSSYPFYVTDTYTVQAEQFFVKPLVPAIVQKELQRILKRYEQKQDFFIRKCSGKELILHKQKIVYIESRKRILMVVLADGSQKEYYGKISDEEQFFSGSSIIRCHRGFLVNLAYVYDFSRTALTLQLPNGLQQTIPVGQTWSEAVKQAFLQYKLLS